MQRERLGRQKASIYFGGRRIPFVLNSEGLSRNGWKMKFSIKTHKGWLLVATPIMAVPVLIIAIQFWNQEHANRLPIELFAFDVAVSVICGLIVAEVSWWLIGWGFGGWK